MFVSVSWHYSQLVYMCTILLQKVYIYTQKKNDRFTFCSFHTAPYLMQIYSFSLSKKNLRGVLKIHFFCFVAEQHSEIMEKLENPLPTLSKIEAKLQLLFQNSSKKLYFSSFLSIYISIYLTIYKLFIR